MRRFILVVLCSLLTSTFMAAEILPRYVQPTEDFVSRHINWNKPSVRGPLKVLFLVPRFGAREVIETCERFDIQREVFLFLKHDVFAYDGSMGQWPGADEKTSAELLKNKLTNDYDVIVIGHIKWSVLPDWAQSAILEKARKGTGLLIRIRGRTPAEIARALEENQLEGPGSLSGYPFLGLPLYRSAGTLEAFKGKYLRIGQLGQGRIVSLDSLPFDNVDFKKTMQVLTPECRDEFPDFYRLHYDYYQAILGHLLNYLAKAEPEVHVRVPEQVLKFPIAIKDLQTIRFYVVSAVDGAFQVDFALRDALYGNVVAAVAGTTVALKRGDNIVPFPVAKVPAGNYFADLWIRKNGKIVNYGSNFLKLVSDACIEKIELAKPYFERSQPVQGRVVIKNASGAARVSVKQVDNYGRVVAEQVLPVAGGKVDFSLVSASQLSVLQTVEVGLLEDNTVVDLKRQRFTYSDLFPSVDEIPLILLQEYKGDSYLNIMLAESSFAAGVDCWLSFNTLDTKQIQAGSVVMANVNLSPTVYGRGIKEPVTDMIVNSSAQLAALKSDYGLVRNPCLTDPEYIKAAHRVYSGDGRFWKPFSPLFYNLGDECVFGPHGSKDDLCFSSTCVGDFQKFIRGEYGTLDKLNAEYGTKYTDFDQVVPVSLDKLKDNPQLIPAWIDHRRQMDRNWAGYLDSARKSIQSEAPGARVGYEGSGETGHGPENGALTATDYYKLSRAMDANLPYYWAFQFDNLRDLSAPGALIGCGWFGGYPQMWRAGHDPLTLTWWMWNGLLRGANSVNLYSGLDGWNSSLIAPDFSFEDYIRKGVLDQMQLARRGAGPLLANSRRENDGMAVLYSAPSMLLSSVSEGMPPFWESACATPIIMGEALQQYRMVASEEVEAGALAQGDYRLLYLPCSLALSDRQVSEILSFANKGGIVLADMRPAVADQHGKTRAKGALDELFGIRQDAARASMITSRVEISVSNLGTSLPPLRVDASLKLDGGKALGKAGEIPALVVHDYGKGKGILLNMLLVDYLRAPKDSISRFSGVENAEKTAGLIRGLLTMTGITPAVRLDHYVPGVKVHRLKAGDTRVMGLVWDAPSFLPGADVLEPWDNNPEIAAKAAAELKQISERKEKVRVQLPSKVHVYDIFTGKYEGCADFLERELSPGKVCLFACLPCQPSGLSIAVAELPKKEKPGVMVSAVLQGVDKASVQIFHIRFRDPGGNDVPYYGCNRKAAGGHLSYRLPLALNEKQGQWTIKVTDAATGISAEAKVAVKKTDGKRKILDILRSLLKR